MLKFGFGGESGETLFPIAPNLDSASGHTLIVMATWSCGLGCDC